MKVNFDNYLSEGVGESGVHASGFLSVKHCSFDIHCWLHHERILYSDENHGSVERSQRVEQILANRPGKKKYDIINHYSSSPSFFSGSIVAPSLAKTPEDCPKKKGRDHGEENPDGGVVGVPPVRFVLLPQAGHALVQEGQRMLRREMKIFGARRRFTQLLYQVHISPVTIFFWFRSPFSR